MSIALDIALLLRDSLDNFGLTMASIGVAYTLAFRVGSNSRTWISQVELAKEVKLDERNLRIHCRKLEACGLICIEVDKRDKRRNSYSFNEAIDNYHAMTDAQKSKCRMKLSGIKEDTGCFRPVNTGCNHPVLSENDPPKTPVVIEENAEALFPKGKEERKTKSKETLYCSSADAKEHENSFDNFWSVYPRKDNINDARRAWSKAIKIETAENIIADVKMRTTHHTQWRDKQFIPLPSTYLNKAQWQNEMIMTGKDHGNGKTFKTVRSFAESLFNLDENVFFKG